MSERAHPQPARAHWHAIPANGAATVETEHDAWHASARPCVFCGAVSWTKGTHHRTPSGLPLSPCYSARLVRSRYA